MSNSSQKRQKRIENALAEVPDQSVAGLLKATAPEVAKELNPRLIRQLSEKSLTPVMEASLTASFWSGPLPPPEQLQQYNNTIPDGADRVFSMAEKQALHRQKLEQIAIEAQLAQSNRGQIFGFTIGIVGIITAGVCGVLQGAASAGAIAVPALTVLAVSFIGGKRMQEKQLQKKSEHEAD